MPRKAPTQVTEMRMTMGNFERALVTEIKTDIEKSIKIATVGAVAVPVTIGVGLVGGMGLLGYGLYQGLSSFGFGDISAEIGKELSEAKNNAWCWWTNKNRAFWGLAPIDCTKPDQDVPPSRRAEERTAQEQLDYEAAREQRRLRTQQRKDALINEMGEDAYNDMILEGSHHGGGSSQTAEERRAQEARREEEREAVNERNRAEREERRRQREEAAANQEDDSGDLGGSTHGGGSSRDGDQDEDYAGRPLGTQEEEEGNAPSRTGSGSNRGDAQQDERRS